MKRGLFLVFVVFSVLIFTTSTVDAGRAKPIVNYENQTWERTDNKALSEQDVKKAIQLSVQDLNKKKYSWKVEDDGDDRMLVTVVVRGKHTALVSITYSSDSFSAIYQSSDNLLYGKKEDGTEIIHHNYNKWIKSMVDSIKSRLANMEPT